MDNANKVHQEVGFVNSIRDFLINASGLPSIRINDIVETENGARGWVNSLLTNEVEILMLNRAQVRKGDLFRKTGKNLNIRVGQFLLGRGINPLGDPIDGRGGLNKTNGDPVLDVEQPVPGISKREFINRQFDTGITLVDTLIPIGKGQRELILSDSKAAKNNFLIDLIVNQAQTGVICVYGSIGKPVTDVRNLIDALRANHGMSHTCVIATSSTDTSPLIFLTPYVAVAVAEYFQKLGKDVLLILDDMGIHAKIYREIALLGNKSPGRESYPGDIFWQHARLLERAGNFNKSAGGGSITALPSIELNMNDFTTYIPTNLMSITDGHLLFRSSLQNQGQRPAIDVGMSVSRVGKQTQNRIQNSLSDKIKGVLTKANQLETVSRFSSELPPEVQLLLLRKQQIIELIKQDSLTCIPKELQTIMLALVFTKFLQNKTAAYLHKNKKTLMDAFSSNPELQNIKNNVFKTEKLDELIKNLEAYAPKLEALCQA